MIVFRLCKYNVADDLKGSGARTIGGRWNSKGVPMIYTSASRALCTAEIAVHTPLGILPDDYYMITIQVPDKFVSTFPEQNLPSDWKSFPHSNSTRKIGDLFIKENKHLVLRVPSAVVQGDYNYLLNPGHRLFPGVRILSIEPYVFDHRLFKHQLR